MDHNQKESLLKRILMLKDDLIKYREQHKKAKLRLNGVEEVYEDKKAEWEEIQQVYRQIQAAFHEAEDERNYIKNEVETLVKVGKRTKEAISLAQREFSRLLDEQRLHSAMIEKVETIKQDHKDAPWRAENRTDNRGALPHQIDGAARLAVAKQGILADKRGLGKTLTALIYCDFVGAHRIIAIVPNDTQGNFVREVKMWTNRAPLMLGGKGKETRDFLLDAFKEDTDEDFIIVMNYEAWRRDRFLIPDLIEIKADALILDEAHNAKDMTKLKTQGVHQLRFGLNQCPECDKSDIEEVYRNPNKAVCNNPDCMYEGFITEFCSIKYVLPMTGTPILNKPQELFPQTRLVDPKNFVKQQDFLSAYCEQNYYDKKWYWRGNGEKEIADKLGSRFLQRDRQAAGVVIPPQEIIEHVIDFEEFQRDYAQQWRAYVQMRDIMQIILDPGTKSTMSTNVVIAQLMRLRQILVWPAGVEIKDENGDVVEHLHVYQSIKLDKAEEIIKQAIDEGDRVVLFSQFKAPLHQLRERLGDRSVIYDGDTPRYLKEEIQKDFDAKTTLSTPAWDVVLCNYKSAGAGLNFQAAQQMVILDSEWNPGSRDQAYGRIDRMGQTKETIVHTINVNDSVDSWMQEIIENKEAIVGGFESATNVLQSAWEALRNGRM